MAEVGAHCPADNAQLSAGHTAQCARYRRAYWERNRSLTRRVCCCASLPETPPKLRETPRKVMPDMPCVWCLLWLNTAPEHRPFQILAHPYGATQEQSPEPVPVRGWAHAEELSYGSQFHIRDSEHGTYFGLDAKTLVSGNAVCIGHAVGALRALVS